jgi:hypothetical protein
MADRLPARVPETPPAVEDERFEAGGAIITYRGHKRITVTNVQHLTPEAATAMQKVAEHTYAVPAREQTKRALHATIQHYGSIGFGAFVLVKVLPTLTDPWVAGGLVALAMVIFGIIRAIKTIKGES